jgi:hypothetical protein
MGLTMPLHLEEIKTEWSYSSTPLYAFMVWTARNLPLFLSKDVSEENEERCGHAVYRWAIVWQVCHEDWKKVIMYSCITTL